MKASERRHLRRLLERRRCPTCRRFNLTFSNIRHRSVLCETCGWFGVVTQTIKTAYSGKNEE